MARRVALVVGLWIGMFAWANVPRYRHDVLEQEPVLFVWNWGIYKFAGHNVCDVRYYDMNQDGAPIERWTLLGYERLGDMPHAIARTHKNNLAREYERVCRALREQGDEAPNVEVWARCGARTKWKQVARRRQNACTTDKQPVKRASAHRSKQTQNKGAKQ